MGKSIAAILFGFILTAPVAAQNQQPAPPSFTTFLKTLLGFVSPTSGTATVLGRDAIHENRQVRQLVGLMPEQHCHIPGMTADMFGCTLQ